MFRREGLRFRVTETFWSVKFSLFHLQDSNNFLLVGVSSDSQLSLWARGPPPLARQRPNPVGAMTSVHPSPATVTKVSSGIPSVSVVKDQGEGRRREVQGLPHLGL